ncbi:tyrosine phosphatase family-domain-containing protein [Scheffersomyces xylosifermentans]|uniref:tyrosine phosphatase family-domain-containing protein n=1 Tax=Scheffersomyces xylosifermentans TaxID=1304137 RepID=UPI00315DC96C
MHKNDDIANLNDIYSTRAINGTISSLEETKTPINGPVTKGIIPSKEPIIRSNDIAQAPNNEHIENQEFKATDNNKIDSSNTESTKQDGNLQISTESRSETISRFYPRPQYVPPLNFSLVEDKIYRSGFPMPINYPYLKQLGLKTIIYLGDLGHESKKKKKDKKDKDKSEKSEKKKDKHGTAEIMAQYQEWITTTDITFHNLRMESSQEPFNRPDEHQQAQESLAIALQLILNKDNFPMLIHSNKGKHRTGLLVGLMRKLLQGWCMSGIFEEYEKFAMGKSEFDLELIELWQPELWVDDDCKPDFVRI